MTAPALLCPQHDPAHRPAGDAFDAGHQLHLPCPAAAAVVPHPLDDLPQLHVALREVRLGKHAVLPAPIAPDPQQPARERGERLVHCLGADRQWVIPIAAPVALGLMSPFHVARRTSSLNSSTAASPRRSCSSASISCTGPNRVERFWDAVTIRGSLAGCAGRLRSVTASLMTGAALPGLGGFAVTIRFGMAGEVFRFRARFGL